MGIAFLRHTVMLGLLAAGLAVPALAETQLPLLPAEDDRAVVEAQAPQAGLSALVGMVAADGSATLPADRELDCLATAVWFESRGEVMEGQLAVAQAVLNRVRAGRWGGSVCAVIRAPRQFSFVPERVQRSTATFGTAMAVARVAMMGLWHDVADGAHSFHAARLKPGWRLTRVARIGNHVFYR
ncbi:cell wall hydrolase [Sandarakinorhabdus rubra]|uniref:cell wall hydrolase n=1 Tax=Sandarakinorhabdus rubra TaxID=2672568 RepID=UPI0013DB92BC|nr:cell wall hydrolase [Sandarakinorhabdus rubra]